MAAIGGSWGSSYSNTTVLTKVEVVVEGDSDGGGLLVLVMMLVMVLVKMIYMRIKV